MKDSDKGEFEKTMFFFAESVDKQWNDQKSDFYWAALKDMSIEQFKAAANRLARTHKFNTIPLPALFLEGQEVNVELQATEAYRKLDIAWKRFGSYRTVIFDDPAIHLALHAWGGDEAWIKLNELKASEEKWFKRDFEKYYQMYTGKEVVNIPSLTGMTERDNGINSQPHKELPSIIGDTQKALAWSGYKEPKQLGEGDE